MPEVTSGGSEKEIRIHITLARNGVIVSGMREVKDKKGHTQFEDLTYVYDSLDEALKEVPSIVSVMKEHNFPLSKNNDNGLKEQEDY